MQSLSITKGTLILSFASGILLFLSFPKYGLGIIAWVALVPLLFALKNVSSLRNGLIVGFITGIVSYTGIVYWIVYVVVTYGYLPYYAGIFFMLLLAAYLSIYIALFAACIVYFSSNGINEIVIAPVLWTCLEYGKSYLFTGFPWENLAYSQYLNTTLIQAVDITGTYGLTFIIVLVNVTIFDILSEKFKGTRLMAEVALCSALMLIIFSYGYLRLHQIDEKLRVAESMDVTLVQGNIDQNIKWDPRFQMETINVYNDLSLQEESSRPGLMVWPETAAPFFFQEFNELHNRILNVAQMSGEWLLFGGPSYLRECIGSEDCISYFNSAFLLSPAGKIVGQYDKVHLVPYGEYVPLRSIFPFISKLAVSVGDFRSGNGYNPLTLDNKKLGVLICYEGIFPEASRTYKNMGVDLLVNMTNDAWFGRTSAPYQHLSMTIFRAVENRLYVIRSANTGISSIIDPAGRIIAKTELFTKSRLRDNVKFMNYKTFYTAYGDIFVVICLISLVCCLLITLRRKYVYAFRNK
jgi:apolipoprotein N-acyltransferase